MGETARQIVFALVAPLAIVLAVVAPGLGARPGAPSGAGTAGSRDRFAWRFPLALATPVALAFVVLYGWPTEQWHHVMFVAPAGLAVGVAMSLAPRSAWVRGSLFAALGALAVLAVWPVLRGESVWCVVWIAGGTMLAVAALEPLAARRPGVSVPGALTLAAGTAAVVVLQSGFIKLTIPLVALATVLAACTALAAWRCDLSLADGAVAVVAPMLIVGPCVAWLYMASSEDPFPVASFVLPAFAPCLMWPGELRPVRERSPWAAVAIRWTAVAVGCGLAVVLTIA